MSRAGLHKHENKSILERYIPIFSWLPQYKRKWLRFDFIAGLTIWGTTIPTSMGYAQMAGLPIQSGLYAAVVGLIAYAVFGTSRLLKVEASSAMAIMSAVIVSQLAGGDLVYYITLSAALALFMGIILIAAGLARMGYLADFLAKPVVTGFLFGLALIIIISQIPALLGFPSGDGTGLQQLWELIPLLSAINMYTLAISVISFLILLLFRRYVPRFPGTIVVLFLGMFAGLTLNLEQNGVELVGFIPSSLPELRVPVVRPSDILYLVLGAAAMVFVALGESVGNARTYASEHHERIDENQELLALGVTNVGTGLFQGFAVGANSPATSSANSMRARTQLASIVTALLVVFTILTQVNLLSYLPQAMLSVAVVVSVTHLISLDKLKIYYRSRKIDFVLAMIALLGVLVTGVLAGLMIAVFLSLAIVLYQTSRVNVAVLGKITGHKAFGDIHQDPDVEPIPGVLPMRIEAQLFFANASTAYKEIQGHISASSEPIKAVIIDLDASSDLDVASTDMLKMLYEDLDNEDIRLLLANVKAVTMTRLKHTGLLDIIGEVNVYLNVAEAVDAFTTGRSE